MFSFNTKDSVDKILLKYKLFTRFNYPRYFENEDSPEHDNLIRDFIESYLGFGNRLEIAFRNFGKTALGKLFVVFVLLNDEDGKRKYIKILSKDLENSKTIVTDVYNCIVEVSDIYGNQFESDGKMKREESMKTFTVNGRKLRAGTVGQTQRGHIQDAYRPDWVIFEDIEDRETISSIVMTEKIIKKCDEAITGLSFGGNYVINANYISDAGVIQWFKDKPSVKTRIIPIVREPKFEGNRLIDGIPTWSRYTIDHILKNLDTDDFFGEYLCDPQRAGDKFFDIEQIQKDIEKAEEPKQKSAGVSYWDFYKPHHRYGMGVDLSDGVQKDSCAFHIFDFNTGKLVSAYDTNDLPPDVFTMEAIRVGREFGNCLIAPEVNNTCGGIAVTTLKDTNYPSIYKQEIFDRVTKTKSKKLGWKTTSVTKSTMLHAFKKDYEDGLIDIPDVRLLKEMKAFTKQDLKDTSKSVITRHFDKLMSACITWQLKDEAGFKRTNLNRLPDKKSLR